MFSARRCREVEGIKVQRGEYARDLGAWRRMAVRGSTLSTVLLQRHGAPYLPKADGQETVQTVDFRPYGNRTNDYLVASKWDEITH